MPGDRRNRRARAASIGVPSACHAFAAQIAALRSDPAQFVVDCNDSGQRFRFGTVVVVQPDVDLAAWMLQHRQSRHDAWQALDRLGAIQR